MKNLVSTITRNRQKKFSFSDECSFVHDPLVSELNISLRGFEIYSRDASFDRVVYDCNSNNLTENAKPKTRRSLHRVSIRRKTEAKKLSEPSEDKSHEGENKEESCTNIAEDNPTINEDSTKNSPQIKSKLTHKQSLTKLADFAFKRRDSSKKRTPCLERKECTDSSESPKRKESYTKITDDNTHDRVSCSSSESLSDEKIATIRRLSNIESPQSQRLDKRYGSFRKSSSHARKAETLFENKASNFDFIDFGSCHSPNDMKAWQLVQKLATWSLRSPSPRISVNRRNFSFSETIAEPAKKLVSQTLPTTLKKRRKSYECQKRVNENFDSTEDDEEEEEEQAHDVSLTRENIDECFVTETDFSFSSNVWYYGELDVKYMNSSKVDITVDENTKMTGSLLVRVDKYGDVVYSITYTNDSEDYVGAFPYEMGKYCLDFSNPEQPRFTSVKFLIAYLIEQNYLFRVTFAWLIENCAM